MVQQVNGRGRLANVEDAIAEVQALARVLGTRNRVAALVALAMGPMDVTRVAEAIGLGGRGVPAASRCLTALCQAGLVRWVRVGNRKVYMLSAAARLDVRGVGEAGGPGGAGGTGGLRGAGVDAGGGGGGGGGGLVRVAEITLDRRGVGVGGVVEGGGGGGADECARGRLTLGVVMAREGRVEAARPGGERGNGAGAATGTPVRVTVRAGVRPPKGAGGK